LLHIERRHKNVVGQLKGFDALATSYQKQGLPISYTKPTPPLLQLMQAAE